MALDKDKLASLSIDREKRSPQGPPWGKIIGGIVLLTAIIVVGMLIGREQVPRVQVYQVETTRTRASGGVLNASGYVNARRMATVSSKFTAKVTEILIEEGMRVDEGQVLATLDDANISRELALAKAELEATRATLRETMALLHEAELNRNRIEDLVSRGFASESQADTARASAESLEARLEAQRKQVKVNERRVDISQQQLEDTAIKAPFEGVIVSKDAQPGEMISPVSAGGGFTRTGIGTLVDMSSLEIGVDVNESYINRVFSGQRVTARLDAYPDWDIEAHVIATIPTADRQKATVEVRIGFDQLDPRVLPDMGVKVTFLEQQESPQDAQAVMRIPQAALQMTADENAVLVVSNGRVEQRILRLDGTTTENPIVLAGLTRGERIVVSSSVPLDNGDKVEVDGE